MPLFTHVNLACSRCPMEHVRSIPSNLADDEGHPRHRCRATGKAADFDVVTFVTGPMSNPRLPEGVAA